MNSLTVHQPKHLMIGPGILDRLFIEVVENSSNPFVIIDPNVAVQLEPYLKGFKRSSVKFKEFLASKTEPKFSDFDKAVTAARDHGTDYILGIGGGSVLDISKLVASLIDKEGSLAQYVGKGLIGVRKTPLCCVPTTSGAGSEASPNAIMIDDSDNAKKGIIDPVLVPDAVYIDPELMVTLPKSVTAYTGLDALTHCIEAYANRNAHPVIDVFALEGIRLIGQNLSKVINEGKDLEAREKVALGAYYGGMCLGPVNTAAVHALAYPLSTKYKIAHGLSNALLLPFVLEFNIKSAESRYAEIALAMGSVKLACHFQTAAQGIALIRKLIRDCGMPARLSELNIGQSEIPGMATEAMKIQRLLKNNVREVGIKDAMSIYLNAY